MSMMGTNIWTPRAEILTIICKQAGSSRQRAGGGDGGWVGGQAGRGQADG